MLLIVYESESRFAIEINCVNQITFIMKIDNSLTKCWISLRPIFEVNVEKLDLKQSQIVCRL